MAFGETVECLARNEVQGDLSFELDAMDAVLGHGFHPLKARQRRWIFQTCKLSTVTPRGSNGRSFACPQRGLLQMRHLKNNLGFCQLRQISARAFWQDYPLMR